VTLRGPEFLVEADAPVPVQVDGDPAGEVAPRDPLRIAVRRAALRVLVPRAGG
jgi:diacylglycerol kinase family enzyme